MTYYDLSQYQNSSPEEKLSLVRMEMIPLIATVKGYSEYLIQMIEYDRVSVPDDFMKLLININEAGESLEKLRQILIEKID